MKNLLSIFLVVAAACGSSSNPSKSDAGGSGGSDSGGMPGPDAKMFLDAPPNVPATITVSGTATQQNTNGGTPAPGVVVAAYRNSDPSTPVTMATTDAQGAFTLMITTNGQPLDGYLKATKTGNADTYLYPPAPLVADFNMASINELSTNLYGTLAGLEGQQPGQGMIILEVLDSAGMPVSGAVVTSTPAATKTGYSVQGSTFPSTTATSTYTDGRAYLFGLNPGQVTVMATKTGSTFASHAVKTYADALTTTLIVP